MAELIGGNGYNDVQATEPSNPSIGDTWLDTSDGKATGKIYADLGNGADWQILPVQDELQSGRTRELLMLLQDKPVPEVQDPMDIQTGVSQNYEQNSSDYQIFSNKNTTADTTPHSGPYADNSVHGLIFNPNFDLYKIDCTVSPELNQTTIVELYDGDNSNRLGRIDDVTGGDTVTFTVNLNKNTDYILKFYDDYTQANGSAPFTSETVDVVDGYVNNSIGGEVRSFISVTGYVYGEINGYVTDKFSAPTTEPADFKQWNAIQARDVTTGGSTSAEPVEFDLFYESSVDAKIDASYSTGTQSTYRGLAVDVKDDINGFKIAINPSVSGATEARITDTNGNVISSVPEASGTVEIPANLQSGNTYYLDIGADGASYTIVLDGNFGSNYPISTSDFDVTSGVSGSALVSSYAYNIDSIESLQGNSTKIPKARIADEPFTMRNRVYSESAVSDGQSDYQIATTGDGGHFGISILTVVSVKKNGLVLDSANWSFDGTDTVTIDTSNVTIASGDTIDIKYDFDVFDSTLQPRAYLNRESSSETSPSISHFKYEYVI